MKPSLLLLAFLSVTSFFALGSVTEFSVTPEILSPGSFVFTVSTKPAPGGTSFRITITPKTGTTSIVNSNCSGFLGTVSSPREGERTVGPLKQGPAVRIKKMDRLWTVDFTASDQLMKNPDLCFVFDVEWSPMPAADSYEIKLRDFMKL